MISVGDKVQYHGTLEEKHGVYRVKYLPRDVDTRDPLWDSSDPERGYVLQDANNPHALPLENVHRNSFDLLMG